MGGGASAINESARDLQMQAVKKCNPTRESATNRSLNLVADLLRHGLNSTSIIVARKPDIGEVNFTGAGYFWGTPEGLHCGRQKLGRQQATLRWNATGLQFSSKDESLMLTCDECEWKVQMSRKPSIAGWLACYLHTFLPHAPSEYQVTFKEWGRLGIAFAVYMDVVIPIVFTVDEPAKSLGVIPGSVLVSLNGTRIFDLPQDCNMLDFISNAEFPKDCMFARPSLPMTRLGERWGQSQR